MQDEYVSTEHLFLGLVQIGGPVSEGLAKLGITQESVLEALQGLRGSQRVTDQEPEASFKRLSATDETSLSLLAKGKSIQLLGVMKRSGASSKSCLDALRTTQF